MSSNHVPTRRALVIRGAAIGDFIVTLPAMRLLKESIPGCQLDVLGDAGIATLAEVAGIAGSVWSLNHRSMAPLFAPGAAIDPDVAERFASYQVVVSYLFDPDGIFRGNLDRIGVKTFIQCPHRVMDGEGPAPVQLARPLERLAMFLDDPAPQILSPTSTGPLRRIVLHPGSGSLRKNWALSHWHRILQRLHHASPDSELIVVTGEAEAERGITAEIQATWSDLPLAIWNRLTLRDLAHELAAAPACFLGHDSGISHLAAACGLPCFLLFGPTDPAMWAPANSGVEVLQADDGSLTQLRPDGVWQRLEPWLAGLFENASPRL